MEFRPPDVPGGGPSSAKASSTSVANPGTVVQNNLQHRSKHDGAAYEESINFPDHSLNDFEVGSVHHTNLLGQSLPMMNPSVDPILTNSLNMFDFARSMSVSGYDGSMKMDMSLPLSHPTLSPLISNQQHRPRNIPHPITVKERHEESDTLTQTFHNFHINSPTVNTGELDLGATMINNPQFAAASAAINHIIGEDLPPIGKLNGLRLVNGTHDTTAPSADSPLPLFFAGDEYQRNTTSPITFQRHISPPQEMCSPLKSAITQPYPNQFASSFGHHMPQKELPLAVFDPALAEDALPQVGPLPFGVPQNQEPLSLSLASNMDVNPVTIQHAIAENKPLPPTFASPQHTRPKPVYGAPMTTYHGYNNMHPVLAAGSTQPPSPVHHDSTSLPASPNDLEHVSSFTSFCSSQSTGFVDTLQSHQRPSPPSAILPSSGVVDTSAPVFAALRQGVEGLMVALGATSTVVKLSEHELSASLVEQTGKRRRSFQDQDAGQAQCTVTLADGVLAPVAGAPTTFNPTSTTFVPPSLDTFADYELEGHITADGAPLCPADDLRSSMNTSASHNGSFASHATTATYVHGVCGTTGTRSPHLAGAGSSSRLRGRRSSANSIAQTMEDTESGSAALERYNSFGTSFGDGESFDADGYEQLHGSSGGDGSMSAAMRAERRESTIIKRDRTRKGGGCSCRKSQCVKRYCACFSEGKCCTDACDCAEDCLNHDTPEMRDERARFIAKTLKRNGLNAFNNEDNKSVTCNCSRSGCQKNYCACYQRGVACVSACKCVGCQNNKDLTFVPEKAPRPKAGVRVADIAISLAHGHTPPHLSHTHSLHSTHSRGASPALSHVSESAPLSRTPTPIFEGASGSTATPPSSSRVFTFPTPPTAGQPLAHAHAHSVTRVRTLRTQATSETATDARPSSGDGTSNDDGSLRHSRKRSLPSSTNVFQSS